VNKADRHRIKMLKYKRRLRALGLYTIEIDLRLTAYRSHGKPCSCEICSPYKHSRKTKHKEYLSEVDEFFNPET